ncbi:hypothetical protein DBV15_01124 [Temnothorax longispinosus]|uniref:Uncharacterized protein n=1 Tax=Temnothorax longispinosus TaxID=300112 RepID=A0A4S2JA99_9HYME|nr:hypothetical protein DBV15_01124 [Temnothorax longispinosus]
MLERDETHRPALPVVKYVSAVSARRKADENVPAKRHKRDRNGEGNDKGKLCDKEEDLRKKIQQPSIRNNNVSDAERACIIVKFNSPSHKVDVFRVFVSQRRILIRPRRKARREKERVNVSTVPCKNRYSASLSHEDPEEARQGVRRWRRKTRKSDGENEARDDGALARYIAGGFRGGSAPGRVNRQTLWMSYGSGRVPEVEGTRRAMALRDPRGARVRDTGAAGEGRIHEAAREGPDRVNGRRREGEGERVRVARSTATDSETTLPPSIGEEPRPISRERFYTATVYIRAHSSVRRARFGGFVATFVSKTVNGDRSRVSTKGARKYLDEECQRKFSWQKIVLVPLSQILSTFAVDIQERTNRIARATNSPADRGKFGPNKENGAKRDRLSGRKEAARWARGQPGGHNFKPLDLLDNDDDDGGGGGENDGEEATHRVAHGRLSGILVFHLTVKERARYEPRYSHSCQKRLFYTGQNWGIRYDSPKLNTGHARAR